MNKKAAFLVAFMLALSGCASDVEKCVEAQMAAYDAKVAAEEKAELMRKQQSSEELKRLRQAHEAAIEAGDKEEAARLQPLIGRHFTLVPREELDMTESEAKAYRAKKKKEQAELARKNVEAHAYIRCSAASKGA